MRPRRASWVTGTAGVILGWGAFRVVSGFQRIFTEMFEGEPLPLLTNFVMLISPAGWLVLLAAIGTAAVAKDFMTSRRLPNWPYVLALGVSVLAVLGGLFWPLTFISHSLST